VRDTLALAIVLLTAAPVSAADVTFVGPDGRVALSGTAQAEVAAIVKREAESCSISSVGYPDIFRGRDGATDWQAAERRPHLYLRYEMPVVMRLGLRGGSPGLASEVLIAVDDPKFPRQPLTRHDGLVTMHGKCSGISGIELMCVPALRPYFDKTAADTNCPLLERVRRRD
jgi:hypothetical protein